MLRFLTIFILSGLIATLLSNKYGDNWEESVRETLYRLRGDSVPKLITTYTDTAGVPYVFYSEVNDIAPGYQYNPTIVANYAIDYHAEFVARNDSADYGAFINCVQWLSANLSFRNGYALYVFDWQQPWYPLVGVPSTSGMSSGRAIEALTYAYQITQDSAYLHTAASLLRAYFIPIEQGSFTYMEPAGWWYEEFADDRLQTPRILDGHIFAISGAQVYQRQTRSDSAAFVIQKGLEALKAALPAYDAGGEKIYYDVYQKTADIHYHRLLTSQMKDLWEQTRDSVYLGYYEKWNVPLSRPYLLRAVKDRNKSGLVLYGLCLAGIMVLLYGLTKMRRIIMGGNTRKGGK